MGFISSSLPVSFCSPNTNIGMSGQKEPQMRNCFLWVFLSDILINDWQKETVHILGSPELYKQADQASYTEQVNKLFSSLVSASPFACFLVLTSYSDGL